MENDELLKSAEKLQREAKRIIDELGLFSILKKISEPSLVGSVENGLMVWPDIDIQAYMKKLNLDKVLNLLREFALLPTVQKVQFSNFRELRRDHLKDRKHFPYAYYVGLRSVQLSNEWKIDIWFWEKENPINNYNTANFLNITKEQKIAILRIKKAWLDEKGGYKDKIASVDIYKAVLERGITNENDFRNFIKNS